MSMEQSLQRFFSTVIVILYSIGGTNVVGAQDYFVDSINGNNQLTGTSSAQAWASIDKVNNTALQPGDTVHFIRGGVWKDTLLVPASGTAQQPITFTDYPNPANPQAAAPLFDGLTEATVTPFEWTVATEWDDGDRRIYYLKNNIYQLNHTFAYWLVAADDGNGTPRLLPYTQKICPNEDGIADLTQLADETYSYSSRCANHTAWTFYIRWDRNKPGLGEPGGPKIYMVQLPSSKHNPSPGRLLDTNAQNHLVIENLAFRGAAAQHDSTAVVMRDSDNIVIRNCEVSLSNNAISTKDAINYGLAGGWLLDRLNLDENSNAVVVPDINVNKNPGTSYGATYQLGVGPFEAPVLYFDGLSSYVDMGLGQYDIFNITGDLTISAWFNHSSTGGNNVVGVEKLGAYHLAAGDVNSATTRFQFRIYHDNTFTQVWSGWYPNDTWHHVAGRFSDGDKLSIFVNGILDKQVTLTGPTNINVTGYPVQVGRRGTWAYYKGYIYDARIYARALTDIDIRRVKSTPYFVTNSTLANNNVHDNIESGIYLTGRSSNNLITGNDVHHNWRLGQTIADRAAIALGAGSPDYPTWHKTGNVVEFNDIHHNATFGTPISDMGVSVYNTKDTVVRYNRIHDNSQGAFYFAFSENCTAHNNLIYRNTIKDERLIAFVGDHDLSAINNTIYDNYMEASIKDKYYNSKRMITIDGPTFHGGVIRNNIIAGNQTLSTTQWPAVLMMAWPSTTAIDHNLYYDNSSMIYDSTSGNNIPAALWLSPAGWFNTLSEWQNAGHDQGSLEGNPNFVATGNDDFHLQYGSPAINTGASTSLTVDFDQLPIIGLPDIGAHEYQGTGQ